MYQNYRNFDVVEVQIMDVYLLRKVLDLTGYFLYSARLHVNKNLFELTKEITNKGDRLQYIHL